MVEEKENNFQERYEEFDEGVDTALEQGQLYEPGEIPPYWQDTLNRYGIRIMQLAMTFGAVVPEYTMRDYVMHAIRSPSGYETINIWGSQGSKKSCRTLACLYWCYGDWDTVLEEIVLLPDSKELPDYKERGFIQKMKSISSSEVIPAVGWDDYTVGMPSSTFKTDIQVYGAVDAAWAAIRTKTKVMILNCPLIDRIGRNVKDNITIEVMLGRNQVEQIERFVRLVGFKHLESNFFKVQIEPLHRFDYRQVPRDVFEEYFEIRKAIADYAIHKMGEAVGDEADLKEDMIGMDEMWKETPVSLTTLNDMVKRNFLEHEKINGKIYVKRVKWRDFCDYVASNPKGLRKKAKMD